MREHRGTPIVGRGISGTMPGTDPLGALLAKEQRAGGNLIKSDEAWRRFRDRTQSGAHARRAFMDSRVRSK